MSFLDSADEDPKRAARRPLLIFILLTLVVGAGASIFTEPSIPTWYAHLVPAGLRQAVATAWRVWRVTGSRAKEMAAYGVQLALNFTWSAIFFAAHQIGLAMIEIALLVLAILVTALLFARRDWLAGLLFLPYLGWTGFAAVLTHAFWLLNP